MPGRVPDAPGDGGGGGAVRDDGGAIIVIDKEDKNEYDVGCDECGFVKTYFADDWDDLMGQMRDDGWLKRKIGKDWEHVCEDCQED